VEAQDARGQDTGDLVEALVVGLYITIVGSHSHVDLFMFVCFRQDANLLVRPRPASRRTP
jgi:hypothetical protein